MMLRVAPFVVAIALMPVVSMTSGPVPLIPEPWALSPAAVVQDRALPDAEALYKTVRENLARAERVTHLYTYRERRTDIHTNPFGRLGTGGTSVFEVYPSPTRRLVYRRLVERDGKPIPHVELAEQDRDYRARVAEVVEEQKAQASGSASVRAQQAEGARQRRQRAMEDVVDTLKFQLKGRTTYGGVPAIVIAFAPKPDARPTTRQGRTAQKFAGTVWVDEAASEVMRIEAKSIDDISYGYGLVAKLGRGTTATVTRRPVGDHVWMPTELTLAGSGRAVLFRKLNVDFSIEWLDYRRLPEELLAPFLDARIQGQSRSRP
jgi:hypothetical protein